MNRFIQWQPYRGGNQSDGGASADAYDDVMFDEGEDRQAINLRAIWAAIYRSRIVIGIIIAVAILLAVASLILTPRAYQARASVQIDQQTTKVLGTEDIEPTLSGTEADRFLQTQIDILGSRSLAKKVSDRLALTANDQFFKNMGVEPPVDVALRQNAILDILQDNLSVNLPRNSRVVDVKFVSRNPTFAAQVANSYAENFIASNIQRKFSTTDYSRQFLQGRLEQAKGRVEQSERDLIEYSRDARLIDASTGASVGQADSRRSLTASNLVALNDSYAAAQSARLLAQERWKEVQVTPIMSLPEVLSNPAMQSLLVQRAELTAKISELRQRLLPDHPTVAQATAHLDEINSQISGLATSIKNSIFRQFQATQRQEGALEGRVTDLKGATLSEQDRGVRYNILKREVDTNRQLYDSLLQRFKELSAQAGVTSNNITSVDVAEIPRKPISPKPKLNLVLGLLAGLIGAAVFVFAREQLDDAIRNPRDMEEKLNLPLLAVVPDQRDRTPVEALDDKRSSLREAYHAARTSIELSSDRGLYKSILVTSSGMAEGKSTSSYSLARDFAAVGRRVLLVDADLRKPSLHKLFEVSRAAKGLSTVLARQTTLQDAIRKTSFDNLSYLPSGPLPPDPAQLIGGESLREMLEDLKSQFDIVVLDAPPVLALADAIELSSDADATIFIVEAGNAHFGQAKNAVRRLRQAGANLIGGIVTKYDPKATGFGAYADYYEYEYSEK